MHVPHAGGEGHTALALPHGKALLDLRCVAAPAAHSNRPSHWSGTFLLVGTALRLVLPKGRGEGGRAMAQALTEERNGQGVLCCSAGVLCSDH